jgi:hypothetical protein
MHDWPIRLRADTDDPRNLLGMATLSFDGQNSGGTAAVEPNHPDGVSEHPDGIDSSKFSEIQKNLEVGIVSRFLHKI